ncbi:hypothetical protein LINGRAHAP2_LOCUS34953 [Linum grandiflorum]
MKELVACGERQAEEAADHNNSPPMSKLTEEVLEEILIRLPDPRSVIQCKIVSKNWCSVISNPYFFRHCICFRKEQAAAAAEEDPFQPGPESVRVSILSFLPLSAMIIDRRDEFNAQRRFKVYNCAEEDNLVLCGFRENYWSDELSRTFFVCNRRTKQWIVLPLSPPKRSDDGHPVFLPVLVCLPCNNSINLDLGGGETFVYSEYRFRVVRMHHHSYANDKVRFDVYCSESPGEWTSHVLGDEVKRLLPYKNPLELKVFKGKLYWMHNSINGVVQFDPFRLDQPPHVFYASQEAATSKAGVWISQGHLHIVRVKTSTSFRVWRFEGGRWIKQCAVTMDMLRWCDQNESAYEDSFRMDLDCSRPFVERLFGKLCDKCEGGKMVPEIELRLSSVIGLHPEDPQIVYLKFNRRSTQYDCLDDEVGVVCNLRMMTLEVFGAVYDSIHSGDWWALQFKKPRSYYWPAQIQNFGKLGGEYYNGGYLSVNLSSGFVRAHSDSLIQAFGDLGLGGPDLDRALCFLDDRHLSGQWFLELEPEDRKFVIDYMRKTDKYNTRFDVVM